MVNWNDTDPAAAGMNARKLQRIGEHLQTQYVNPAKIPGCLTVVQRAGQLAYTHVSGERDRERSLPMTPDTVFRIYSMTKPITSLAIMMLWERGLLTLDDPVHRYIPAWQELRVRTGGSWPDFETRPMERPMRIRDLLCHTAGLTYDFMYASNIDRAYRRQGVARPKPGYALSDMIDQLTQLPLEFSPGEAWNYSVATDVLGYLVEVIAGESFPAFLKREIFDPLNMVDTGFGPREDQLERFAACYIRDSKKQLVCQDDPQASSYVDRTFFSGGGGLLSTASDYLRFCSMLANGGEFEGARIVGRRTLELMTANHLPGGNDLASLSVSGFSETHNEGVGFGLGFARKIDPVRNGYPASVGTFYWGGLASTLFWVDPAEELIVLFMTQLIPSSTFNFRGQLEAMVYAALD